MLKIITDKTQFKDLGPLKDNLTTIKLENKIFRTLKGLVKTKKLPQKIII